MGIRTISMVVVAALALGACKKTQEEPAPACPVSFKELAQQSKDATGPLRCACSGAATGSIWGTDIYTQDSSICGAAQHAGVIDAKGGDVEVAATDGCESYVGTVRNGVTTSAWGQYPGSFYFTKNAKPACTTKAAAAPPVAPKEVPIVPAKTAIGACPLALASLGDVAAGQELECTCTPEAASSPATVWGSGTYTLDSGLCAAAVHAGVIDGKGGTVKAKVVAGCSKYVGSDVNGIKTASYGSYSFSMYFPAKGDGACAQ